jgi:uncharacterized membrane protein
MFAILALASAAFYGAADFIGGMTARRAATMAIVLLSQAAGLALVVVMVALLGTPVPGTHDWVWGALAGVAGGGGVALLYRALAIGVMSLVAPVTAVCAVAVPVVVAVLWLDERPTWQATLGIALALLAVALVSQGGDSHGKDPSRAPRRRGLGLAIVSGIAIGLFFLALARTTDEAGLWPLVFARISSVGLFGALIAMSRTTLSMAGNTALLAVGGGVLDMLANLLYLLASRQGPLTLVVTLSSLYPASTVLLARFVLHERLTPRQWIGVGMALLAIVAIVME